MKRLSGVLMHITSLPSRHGIGTLGDEAYKFVDFLRAAGQTYWQVLPVGPTGFGDSPYQPTSVFAGNPYLIDIDILCDEGLLSEEEVSSLDEDNGDKAVDYGRLFAVRDKILRKAFERFDVNDPEFAAFCEKNEHWLYGWAMYDALKSEYGMRPWTEWEESVRMGREEELNSAADRLCDDILFSRFKQFVFEKQWQKLREYANSRGIKMVGDVPIYASSDSADVWSEKEQFLLGEDGRPTEVAGVPPDAFSKTGQLWGNPLYCWDKMHDDGFGWWKRRMKRAAELFDAVRLDHFRGFESFWSVPFGAETAAEGKWVKGPGKAFVDMLRGEFPQLEIIAEDLGFLTDDVYQLLEYSGYPGMKVMQFAFSGEAENPYLTHNHVRNCVVYTGTHDNDTLCGWCSKLPEWQREYILRYAGGADAAEAVIRCAEMSVADLVIIPMQDWLKLGSEARMNTPGLSSGNWQWRIKKDALTDVLADKILSITKTFGR